MRRGDASHEGPGRLVLEAPARNAQHRDSRPDGRPIRVLFALHRGSLWRVAARDADTKGRAVPRQMAKGFPRPRRPSSGNARAGRRPDGQRVRRAIRVGPGYCLQ
jgi:hypothetical protein